LLLDIIFCEGKGIKMTIKAKQKNVQITHIDGEQAPQLQGERGGKGGEGGEKKAAPDTYVL